MMKRFVSLLVGSLFVTSITAADEVPVKVRATGIGYEAELPSIAKLKLGLAFDDTQLKAGAKGSIRLNSRSAKITELVLDKGYVVSPKESGSSSLSGSAEIGKTVTIPSVCQKVLSGKGTVQALAVDGYKEVAWKDFNKRETFSCGDADYTFWRQNDNNWWISITFKNRTEKGPFWEQNAVRLYRVNKNGTKSRLGYWPSRGRGMSCKGRIHLGTSDNVATIVAELPTGGGRRNLTFSFGTIDLPKVCDFAEKKGEAKVNYLPEPVTHGALAFRADQVVVSYSEEKGLESIRAKLKVWPTDDRRASLRGLVLSKPVVSVPGYKNNQTYLATPFLDSDRDYFWARPFNVMTSLTPVDGKTETPSANLSFLVDGDSKKRVRLSDLKLPPFGLTYSPEHVQFRNALNRLLQSGTADEYHQHVESAPIKDELDHWTWAMVARGYERFERPKQAIRGYWKAVEKENSKLHGIGEDCIEKAMEIADKNGLGDEVIKTFYRGCKYAHGSWDLKPTFIRHLRSMNTDEKTLHALSDTLHALPATGPVTVDGELADWDLKARQLYSDDITHGLDRFSATVAAMYDDKYLYFAIDWVDDTPMGNDSFPFQKNWGGDSFQLFTKADEKIATNMFWYCGTIERNVVTSLSNTPWKADKELGTTWFSKTAELGNGSRCAFKRSPNGRGYVQEIAIPLSHLSTNKLGPGSQLRALFDLVWGGRGAHYVIHGNHGNFTRNYNLPERPNRYGTLIFARQGEYVRPEYPWEAEKKKSENILATVQLPEEYTGLAVSPDETTVALTTRRSLFHCPVSELRGGKEPRWRRVSETGGLKHPHFLDGARVVAAKERSLWIVDLKSSTVKEMSFTCQGPILAVAVGAEARLIAVADLNREVHVWDLKTGQIFRTITLDEPAMTMAFSRDSRLLVLGGSDGSVTVCDLLKGGSRNDGVHGFAVKALAMTRKDGVLTASDDMAIGHRGLDGKVRGKPFVGHESPVRALVVLNDNQFISAALDGTVRSWDLDTGKTVDTVPVSDSLFDAKPLISHGIMAVVDRTNLLFLKLPVQGTPPKPAAVCPDLLAALNPHQETASKTDDENDKTIEETNASTYLILAILAGGFLVGLTAMKFAKRR